MMKLSKPDWLPEEPDDDTRENAKRALLLQMKPFIRQTKPFTIKPEAVNLLKPKHVIAALDTADYDDEGTPLLLPETGYSVRFRRKGDPVLRGYDRIAKLDRGFSLDQTVKIINNVSSVMRQKVASMLAWTFIVQNISMNDVASVAEYRSRKEMEETWNRLMEETIQEYGEGLREAYQRICTGTCIVQ